MNKLTSKQKTALALFGVLVIGTVSVIAIKRRENKQNSISSTPVSETNRNNTDGVNNGARTCEHLKEAHKTSLTNSDDSNKTSKLPRNSLRDSDKVSGKNSANSDDRKSRKRPKKPHQSNNKLLGMANSDYTKTKERGDTSSTSKKPTSALETGGVFEDKERGDLSAASEKPPHLPSETPEAEASNGDASEHSELEENRLEGIPENSGNKKGLEGISQDTTGNESGLLNPKPSHLQNGIANEDQVFNPKKEGIEEKTDPAGQDMSNGREEEEASADPTKQDQSNETNGSEDAPIKIKWEPSVTKLKLSPSLRILFDAFKHATKILKSANKSEQKKAEKAGHDYLSDVFNKMENFLKKNRKALKKILKYYKEYDKARGVTEKIKLNGIQIDTILSADLSIGVSMSALKVLALGYVKKEDLLKHKSMIFNYLRIYVHYIIDFNYAEHRPLEELDHFGSIYNAIWEEPGNLADEETETVRAAKEAISKPCFIQALERVYAELDFSRLLETKTERQFFTVLKELCEAPTNWPLFFVFTSYFGEYYVRTSSLVAREMMKEPKFDEVRRIYFDQMTLFTQFSYDKVLSKTDVNIFKRLAQLFANKKKLQELIGILQEDHFLLSWDRVFGPDMSKSYLNYLYSLVIQIRQFLEAAHSGKGNESNDSFRMPPDLVPEFIRRVCKLA